MIAVIMSFITWCLMVWFVWLFYGALRSINKIDDNMTAINESLEVLEDISMSLHELCTAYVGPKQIVSPRKNRIVRHNEEELAEREKKDK